MLAKTAASLGKNEMHVCKHCYKNLSSYSSLGFLGKVLEVAL